MTHRTDRAGRSQSAGAEPFAALVAPRVLRREQSSARAAAFDRGVGCSTGGGPARVCERWTALRLTRAGASMAVPGTENTRPRCLRAGRGVGAPLDTPISDARDAAECRRTDQSGSQSSRFARLACRSQRPPCLLSLADATTGRGTSTVLVTNPGSPPSWRLHSPFGRRPRSLDSRGSMARVAGSSTFHHSCRPANCRPAHRPKARWVRSNDCPGQSPPQPVDSLRGGVILGGVR